MFTKIRNDLPAGIVVFLVALPLCLGVALASGAPLLSGIISGIIGGIVVGLLSQSHCSVSGPAAGLAAVVVSAITKLGSFEIFLLAIFIAGFLQLVAGILKGGFIADYIPSNVIKGLLAAIGIILILKQIPHAVGYDSNTEDDFSFIQKDGENTLSALLNIFSYFSWGAIIIAVFSFLVLIFWEKTALNKIKFFPASLFVVIAGIAINAIYKNSFPALVIEPTHLVSIPEFTNVSSLITLPAFSSIGNYKVWLVAFTIAIIASLETLLNLEATENIDPHKRRASPNRELVAQGVGNMVAGLLGGIPVTSVIVRSSVNISSGAQSKMATIFHGILLLVSILFLVPFLNLIPLSSLAVILIITGYKLAKVSLFKEMYKKGLRQFIPFAATIAAIIFTDLLIGILIGLAISIFYLLKSNYGNPFKADNDFSSSGETVRIELPTQVSFLNKASIKEKLWTIPNSSKVIIDATNSDFIDHDVLEIINDYKQTVSVENNIQLNIVGLKDTYKLEDHIQFINVLDKDGQQKLSPDEIIAILKKGNDRFVKGKYVEKYLTHQVNATSFGQNPMAVIISCMDSRTSPELIFDSNLGDLISIRIAGNIISKEITGSIELACKKIGTKLIVVLGHSNCGAVDAAMNQFDEGNISAINNKIEKAIIDCNYDRNVLKHDPAMITKIIKANINNSLQQIIAESTYLFKKIEAGETGIVAAYYDTETGVVSF